jgi:hypothetical protein
MDLFDGHRRRSHSFRHLQQQRHDDGGGVVAMGEIFDAAAAEARLLAAKPARERSTPSAEARRRMHFTAWAA